MVILAVVQGRKTLTLVKLEYVALVRKHASCPQKESKIRLLKGVREPGTTSVVKKVAMDCKKWACSSNSVGHHPHYSPPSINVTPISVNPL